MGKPAARITDMHTCPMTTGTVPHVGGPIVGPGCPTVLIGGLPAARVTDVVICAGPPDMIATGSHTVKIGGLFAARAEDTTVHEGVIISGFPTVLIGDKSPIGASGASEAPGIAGGSSAAAGGSPWDSMADLLSSGAALTAPLTQARTLVLAARAGVPFCERCTQGR